MSARKGATRTKAGIQTLPLAKWPAEVRERFEGATKGFNAAVVNRLRRTYGALLAFRLEHGLGQGRESVERFAEYCRRAMARDACRLKLNHLASVLTLVEPSQQGLALLRTKPVTVEPGFVRARRLRAQAGDVVLATAPFDTWPDEHRRRWVEGLRPEPPQAAADPYAAARQRARQAAAVSVRPTFSAAHPVARAPRRAGGSERVSSRRLRPTAGRRKAKHPSTWTEATVIAARRGWGMWLRAAESKGRDPDAISPETLSAYVEEQRARGVSERSVAIYVGELRLALSVLRPGETWLWVSQDATCLADVARPVNDKFAKLVPITAVRQAGFDLMAKAASGPPNISGALLYRDGLLVAWLAMRPKRRRNTAETRIGSGLILDEDGLTPTALAVVRTKSGYGSLTSFPEVLIEPMKAWLQVWRPLLDIEGSDYLWLTKSGKPMSPARILGVVSTVTRRMLGVPLSPHLLRTLYATSMGGAAPDALRDVSRMLDQGDEGSVEIYEAVAESSFGAAKLSRALDPLVTLPSRRSRRTRA